MTPKAVPVNASLTPQAHYELRPLGRKEFTNEDLRGLKRALRRDPFHHTLKDVGNWLASGEMTMWRLGGFGMLLQEASDHSALCITYIWGKGLREHWPTILRELEALAKAKHLRFITATFASERLFKVFPATRLAYIYGMHEVK